MGTWQLGERFVDPLVHATRDTNIRPHALPPTGGAPAPAILQSPAGGEGRQPRLQGHRGATGKAWRKLEFGPGLGKWVEGRLLGCSQRSSSLWAEGEEGRGHRSPASRARAHRQGQPFSGPPKEI